MTRIRVSLLCVLVALTFPFAVNQSSDACPQLYCPYNGTLSNCLWDPTYSACEGAATQTKVTCYCDTPYGHCSNWQRSAPASSHPITVDPGTGARPAGACNDIPCGECYDLFIMPCRETWLCRNSEGLESCSPFVSCVSYLVNTSTSPRYLPTGVDCCQNQY
jgi:hypothetical protein